MVGKISSSLLEAAKRAAQELQQKGEQKKEVDDHPGFFISRLNEDGVRVKIIKIREEIFYLLQK